MYKILCPYLCCRTSLKTCICCTDIYIHISSHMHLIWPESWDTPENTTPEELTKDQRICPCAKENIYAQFTVTPWVCLRWVYDIFYGSPPPTLVTNFWQCHWQMYTSYCYWNNTPAQHLFAPLPPISCLLPSCPYPLVLPLVIPRVHAQNPEGLV